MAQTEYIANHINLKVPIIKENVVITKYGNECVINPSFKDETEPYVITLNDTGTFILNKIDGIKTIKDILEKMTEYYDINEKIAKKDLYELIKDLEEGKIIEWKN